MPTKDTKVARIYKRDYDALLAYSLSNNLTIMQSLKDIFDTCPILWCEEFNEKCICTLARNHTVDHKCVCGKSWSKKK